MGWPKAEILIARYNSFGDTEWTFRNEALDETTCGKLSADVIITCVDNAKCRVMVGEVGRKRDGEETLWVDTGNDARSGQVILGHWSNNIGGNDGPACRIPNVLDLYPSLREASTENEASCSTEEAITRQDFGINQRVASEASGMLWQLIRHGELRRHGSFVYLDSGEVLPLAIDPKTWESFAA